MVSFYECDWVQHQLAPLSLVFIVLGSSPLGNYYAEWPHHHQQPSTVGAHPSRKQTFFFSAQRPRWHAETKAALFNQPLTSLQVFFRRVGRVSVFTLSDLVGEKKTTTNKMAFSPQAKQSNLAAGLCRAISFKSDYRASPPQR